MPPTISFASTTVTKPSARSIYQTKMSTTQTSMIAHQARQKLAKEANCPDYNLHRLVCHANMLDTLIIDLAHAKDEQESCLNQPISGAQKPTRRRKTEKWDQVVMETLEEESEGSDEQESSSDDDSSDEEFGPRENRASEKANGIVILSSEELGDANELQEEHARLALERTKTRHHPLIVIEAPKIGKQVTMTTPRFLLVSF
jgi:hypothetical protein